MTAFWIFLGLVDVGIALLSADMGRAFRRWQDHYEFWMAVFVSVGALGMAAVCFYAGIWR